MYILFDTNGDVDFIEEENDLWRKLMNLCFIWANDERYTGMDYEELFNWCRNHHDFGDIAQVFKCEVDVLGADIGETVKMTRIY